jgi:hypothetical protein
MQDLSKFNRDHATFLPAISGFYTGMLSRQQDRVPAGFENGIEGMNFLDPDKGYFFYDKALYSAGHAYLDLEKSVERENMVWTRDRDKTVLVSDSGGFQIGKGVIKFDWEHFYEKKGDKGYVGKADKTRLDILTWQEHISEWSMVLDVPGWATQRPETGIKNFEDCLKATMHNNEFYLDNRLGMTKFLNVLQGGNWDEAQVWYEAVKDYEFEGWGMGGQNMCDMEIVLKRLIIMRDEGKLEGKDWIHFLGTSRMDWACYLTQIQRQLRKHANPNLTVSYDCASPFVAVANGKVYTQPAHFADKWTYCIEFAPDNKAFKGSNIPWPFQSEIADRLKLGDICAYGPGDLNKIGKEGKTSWDSFSYALIMAHNVYQHIRCMQIANDLVDIETQEYSLNVRDWKKLKGKAHSKGPSEWVPRNILYFAPFVEELFTSSKPMTLIEDNRAYLKDISNTANRGTKPVDGSGLFEYADELEDKDVEDMATLDDAKLDELEDMVRSNAA